MQRPILERVFRFLPAVDSLRRYGAFDARADALAGITVAAVAVPQAMAYAMVAGLPAQYGLYTAIVMTAVGAIFDSSRQLINGPTNAISIALLSALALVEGQDQKIQAAVLLAFMVGVIQLGITLLRLGDLTRYISHSVIVGFTLGASGLLVLDQLKNLLGLRGGGRRARRISWCASGATLAAGGGIHAETAAIGLGTIALVLGLRWLKERLGYRLLPDLLIAVRRDGGARRMARARAAWRHGGRRDPRPGCPASQRPRSTARRSASSPPRRWRSRCWACSRRSRCRRRWRRRRSSAST